MKTKHIKLIAEFPKHYTMEQIEDIMVDIEALGYGTIEIPFDVVVRAVPEDFNTHGLQIVENAPKLDSGAN